MTLNWKCAGVKQQWKALWYDMINLWNILYDGKKIQVIQCQKLAWTGGLEILVPLSSICLSLEKSCQKWNTITFFTLTFRALDIIVMIIFFSLIYLLFVKSCFLFLISKLYYPLVSRVDYQGTITVCICCFLELCGWLSFHSPIFW